MRKGEKFDRIKISEKDYEHLKKVEKKETSAKILKRIYAFKLLYEKWKYTKVASFIGVTNDTITDWINIYKERGIKALLTLNYNGRIPILTESQLEELKKKKNSFLDSKEAQAYIKSQYGIEYNLNYVQELLKKNFNYPIKKQEMSLEK